MVLYRILCRNSNETITIHPSYRATSNRKVEINLKIRTKLLGAIIAVIIIFVAGNIFTITKINAMQKDLEYIDQAQIPSMLDIGILNGDISDVQRLIDNYVLETYDKKEDSQQQLNVILDEITKASNHYKTIASPQEQQLFEKFSTNWTTYTSQLPAILADGKTNNFAVANLKIRSAYISWTEANNDLDAITAINKKNAANLTKNSIAAAKIATQLSIILSLVASIIGLVIAFFLSNRMSRSLVILARAATKIADGNLTEEIPVMSKDELGELAKVFNKMSTDLREIIREVIDSACSLGASSEELSALAQEASASSEQVSATMTQLASGAVNQARSVEETGVAINQISLNSHQVTTNAETVSQSSEKAAQVAKLGTLSAKNAIQKIEKIRETSTKTAEVVFSLGDQSKEIGQIVDVIKGIADQTNLLALNAAIEAARAGEQGRGFAVVAEEVRKLAEQSSLSAAQIATLIGNIQRETQRAVEVMETGKSDVAAGVEAVTSAGSSFQIIVEEINMVVDQIQQVTAATQQMADQTTQVVEAIDSIGVIAEQTAASTEEISSASEEQATAMLSVSQSAEALAQLGERLTRLVDRFTV